MRPEDRRRHYLDLVNVLSKSAVAQTDLTTDLTAYPGLRTYRVRAENYAVVHGKTLTVLLPGISGALFPTTQNKRKNPMFLWPHEPSEQRVHVILPKGYRHLPLLPEARHWCFPSDLGSFDLNVAVSTRADGRTQVTFIRKTVFTSGCIPALLYPSLLEYNRIQTHPSSFTLVAERP